MPSSRVGKQVTLWTKRGPVERVRFCQCHHGKDAHRNGEGYCLGERKIRIKDAAPPDPYTSERGSVRYVDCECQRFVERDPNAPKVRRR